MAGSTGDQEEGSSVVDALDRGDAVEILQLGQHLVQLPEVPDLHVDDDLGEVGGDASHVEVTDVDV